MTDVQDNRGPAISIPPMSVEELAAATMRIAGLAEEREKLKRLLAVSENDRNRALDRVQLIQVQLEKAEQDRDMYMRAAAKWAERVLVIASLAQEASDLVAAYARAETEKRENPPHTPPPTPSALDLLNSVARGEIMP